MNVSNCKPFPDDAQEEVSDSGYVLQLAPPNKSEQNAAVFVMNDWTDGQFYVFESDDTGATYRERLYHQAEIALRYGNRKLTLSGRETARRILNFRDMEQLRKRKFEAKARKQDDPGYVYVLRIVGQIWCKIGKTTNLKSRLKSYRTHLPFDIEIVRLIRTKSCSNLEAELHAKFADRRGNGEWFSLDDGDMEYLNSLAVQE